MPAFVQSECRKIAIALIIRSMSESGRANHRSVPTQCSIAKNSHIAIVSKELIATPRDSKIVRSFLIANRMARTEQGMPIAQNLNE
jgi:hypothetical protein